MSFFEGLKKVIQGKPVFEPMTDAAPQNPAETKSVSSKPVKVYITETNSRLNGDRLEIYCKIKNESDQEVLIDKIRLLGTSRELDETIRPGQTEQMQVFSGEAPSNSSQHDAELQYRTSTGAYFKARHDVRFKPQDDYYIVERMPYENTSGV